MQKNNNIFKCIDFVLKKIKIDLSDIDFKNFYIFNRWLSMSNTDTCKIINATTNRWLVKNTSLDILKFYRLMLPKTNRNINYIKKESTIKDTEQKDIIKIANNCELSIREIEIYEETLDFLTSNIN